MTTFNKTIFLSLLLSTGLLACSGGDKTAAAPGAKGGMPPAEVDVLTAVKSNAILTQDLPGRLQAFRTAQVRARIDGVIETRFFKEGSDVQAGEALFKIDARTYSAAALSAQIELQNAQKNIERYKPLLEIGAVSQLEYDLLVAKARQAEANLARDAQDMENTNVPAPISGRIGRTLVSEGALVSKAEATLLATIEQLDPIYVNFTQSSNDLMRLRQGMKRGQLKRADTAHVELLLNEESVYPYTGKIFFTDMAVDPDTGSVTLRAEFPNPKSALLPGMFVRIRFPEAVAQNVIRIPQRAVQSGPQGQFVLVVGAENKVMPVPVTTSSMTGGDFIISTGLKGGEQVIINGLQKARPGAVVNPVSLSDAGKPLADASKPQAAPNAATKKP